MASTSPLGVDFVEALADNYVRGSAITLHNLDRAAARVPVVLHGVGLDLLGSAPLDRPFLSQVKALADRVDAPCVTEHLCWSAHRGQPTHDLLPVPLTQAVARYAAARIRVVQDVLERPFGVENLAAMFGCTDDAVTEAEFLAEVVELADCGVLLDVNNLWVSSHNLGHDPAVLFALLDPRRVLYAHLAGQALPAHGPIVDTHDAPVRDEVWALYTRAWGALGPFPTLVEWDASVPPWERCVEEVERARRIRRPLPDRPSFAAAPRGPAPPEPEPPEALVTWQDSLLAALQLPLIGDPPHVSPPLTAYAPATVQRVRGPHGSLGLGTLHGQVVFRWLSVLQEAFPTLAQGLGVHTFNRLGLAYLAAHPPTDRDLNQLGETLPAYLAASLWSSTVLVEAAALDAARTAVLLAPVTPTFVPPPADQLAAAWLRPAPTARRVPQGPVTWMVFRTPDLQLQEGPLPPGLARLLTLLDEHPLGEALAHLEADAVTDRVELSRRVEGWLATGLQCGWWAASTSSETSP